MKLVFQRPGVICVFLVSMVVASASAQSSTAQTSQSDATQTTPSSAQSNGDSEPAATASSEGAENGAAVVQAQPPVASTQRRTTAQTLPDWEVVGGFEADSHGTGYGFFGPSFQRTLRPRVAFIGRLYANYLYYEYRTHDGDVTVRSPGFSPAVGLKFGERNWVDFTVGLGISFRHQEFGSFDGSEFDDDESDVRFGPTLGADVWANPTSRNNVHGILHYNAADQYTWSRVAFKQQITNISWQNKFTHYLGVEGIGQGNEDIRSFQFGGFIEFLHAPTGLSLMLRSGYKRSMFDVGPDKTGPWFAISLYRPLR